jgi:hypothetical protein
MHKRIFGLETEYAIFHHQTNPLNSSVLSGSEIFEMINNVMDAEGIKRIYEEKFYPDSNSASRSTREERRRYSIKKNRMFLSNGGRFYLDTGDHPEFATPECIDPKEALIYDKAGERILEELSAACEEELERLNIGGKIYVCKNNMDTRGNTYGCHENYLVIRRRGNLNESGFFKLMIKAIIPFLVTRQIFCGAGKVFSSDTLAFQISQRADLIDSELSSDTTFRRGIINSRDEPLCQLDKYRRLHILVGDSNMSEISSFIKIGATGIVLQLIEEEEAYNPEIELEDPIKALREISKDPTCTCKVRLNNGQKVTALQIQREYLKRAQNHFNRATISLNNINKHILHLWENLLSRLEKDPANLRQEVDWAIKKSLIDKYLDRFKITPAELNRWTYIIKKIKGLRLEDALLFQNQVDKNFDVMSFLEERLSQADFLDLKKYCRTAELDLKDYFKSSKLYYGLLERDIKYHDIRQDRSIFYLLQKRGFVRRLNGKKLDEEINRAKHYPPLNTRAKIRGDFIRMLYDKKLAGAATWDTLTIYGNTTRKIPLLHPFVNQSIKLEDLLDKDTLKKIGREQSPH